MLVVAIFRLYLYKNKPKNCSNLKAEINNYNHILKLKTDLSTIIHNLDTIFDPDLYSKKVTIHHYLHHEIERTDDRWTDERRLNRLSTSFYLVQKKTFYTFPRKKSNVFKLS